MNGYVQFIVYYDVSPSGCVFASRVRVQSYLYGVFTVACSIMVVVCMRCPSAVLCRRESSMPGALYERIIGYLKLVRARKQL